MVRESDGHDRCGAHFPRTPSVRKCGIGDSYGLGAQTDLSATSEPEGECGAVDVYSAMLASRFAPVAAFGGGDSRSRSLLVTSSIHVVRKHLLWEKM